MKGAGILAFLPEAAIPVLVVVAALALIVGARRLAGALFVMVLGMVLLPPFIAPILNQLPWWALALLVVFVALAIFREVAALFLGKGGADAMTGHLAADFVKALLFFPRIVFRWIFGR